MVSETLTPAQQEQIDNRDSQGQFTEKRHSDVEDTTAVLGLNDDLPAGTFHHPPYMETAEETIAFFNRVEVDDETIEQFQDASEERQQEEYSQVLTAAAEESAQEWEKSNPRPGKPKHVPQWEQSRREFVDAERERLRTGELGSYEAAGVSRVIRDAEAQTIIRTYQMARYAPNDPAEKQKVFEHKVHLRRSDQQITVGELALKYDHPVMAGALDRLPDKNSDSDDLQRQMLQELRRFNENAEAMHNTQNSIRHNTGTLLDNYNNDRTADEIARGWRDANGNPVGPGRSFTRRMLGG